MADVPEVCTRACDPRRPPVCLDQTSRQLLAQVTPPRPLAPGQPARQASEYARRGGCHGFLVGEPLRGWRDVTVSQPRTRIDWAHGVKDLVDVHDPDAEQLVLVQDNLNPHTPASLDEAFEPAEAERLADRLELHDTPKHGSWLNMAEIELSVLAGPCLDRRLADQATLQRRSRRGRQRATLLAVGSTGASRPLMPESSPGTSTLQFRADDLLDCDTVTVAEQLLEVNGQDRSGRDVVAAGSPGVQGEARPRRRPVSLARARRARGSRWETWALPGRLR
jgi:hypothetical protein